MGKKALSGAKAAAKAAKKAAQAAKSEKKESKASKKSKGSKEDSDEEDLIQTLAEFRKKWEEEHKTSEDIAETPSPRVNATFTACPVSGNLWMMGGELFDGQSVHFYNDLYRYSPDKNEWRVFRSPTCPGPRSAHQTVAVPSGGGRLFLFGGEFASKNQSTFHHWSDLWIFDIPTMTWERHDTKVKPSARSGHRMAVWKHLIVLFGGFHDVGVKTKYLQDLWLFDTHEYRWHEVQMKEFDRKPSPRSGFSFVPSADGILLHGGYSKEYKGKVVKGVPHDDTFFLRMDAEDYTKIKWDKRKRLGPVPSPRSGSTMAHWSAKNTAVMFGGVVDLEEDEETMQSVFYNDMAAYDITGNGKWRSLNLKRPKKQGGKRRAKPVPVQQPRGDENSDDSDDESGEPKTPVQPEPVPAPEEDEDPDDPIKSLPRPRYNALLAIQKNTLYLYGGILESGNIEYALDDFYSLSLDKLDRFTCLKECDIAKQEWKESDDEDSDDEEDDEEDKSEVIEEPEVNEEEEEEFEVEEIDPAAAELRKKAAAFLEAAGAAGRQQEEIMSTPLPGETVAMFYDRTKDYWIGKAHEVSDTRGKELRREGFHLADERYQDYKPILLEIEKMHEEAGIDSRDLETGVIRQGTSTAARNRR